MRAQGVKRCKTCRDPQPYLAVATSNRVRQFERMLDAKETTVARIIKRFLRPPYKIAIGNETIEICMCGLSKNQPFCDGSHDLTNGENPTKLYWYDGNGKRHECPNSLFPGIRVT